MSIILTKENESMIQSKILEDYNFVENVINPSLDLIKFIVQNYNKCDHFINSISFKFLTNDEYDEIFEYIINNNKKIHLNFNRLPSLNILEKNYKKDSLLFTYFDYNITNNTPEIIKIKLYHHGAFIYKINNITFDDLKIAVRTYPQILNIDELPEYCKEHILPILNTLSEIQYLELCDIALNESFYNFYYIDDKKISNKIYIDTLLISIDKKLSFNDEIIRDFNDKAIIILKKYLPQINDYEIYKKCVDKFNYFEYVPKQFITDEIITIALNIDTNNLKYVSDFTQNTYNIIINILNDLVVSETGLQKKGIYNFLTINEDFIKLIPLQFQDEKISLLLCYCVIENIAFIKKEFLTLEFYSSLFNYNFDIIRYTPEHILCNIPYDIWFKNIKKLGVYSHRDIECLKSKLPETYLTDEVLEYYINNISHDIIKLKMPSYDTIKKIIINKQNFLYEIFKTLNEEQKIELLELQVEKFPSTIFHFPIKYQTKDICKKVIRKKIELNDSLPFKFKINELFDKQVKDFLDECPVCKKENKYYAKFKCHEEHIICLDCIETCNKCYYLCKNGDIDFTYVYVNCNFFPNY